MHNVETKDKVWEEKEEMSNQRKMWYTGGGGTEGREAENAGKKGRRRRTHTPQSG